MCSFSVSGGGKWSPNESFFFGVRTPVVVAPSIIVTLVRILAASDSVIEPFLFRISQHCVLHVTPPGKT